nr:reverse transcriptase domain-containing protein [Tanacetum cinerariifolium]
MWMSYTDVAQVANAARNYEILHERDDQDTERPNKRQRSGDRHQPTSQQSSHRSHGQNNDRHGSDRRGGNDNHRGNNNNNYSSSNNRNSGNGRDQRNRGHQSNRSTNSGSQQSRGPSLGYSYPVCTTCGRRHQEECRRAAEIREDFRTSSGPSDAGGNLPPVTIHTWLEHFNKQKPYSFEKATTPSSHRNHGHNNDRHGPDRRGGGDNHRSNNNYSGNNNRNSGNGHDQRHRGQQSNRYANSGSQQSRGPSEGYSYPVCTTCGRRHLGECRRAAGTCFKCGQAGHLQKDCKKNTNASTSGQADKKPGASGRVFAITEDHAIKTSDTFQRCMMAIFHDMIEETMEVFMDDFSILGDSFSFSLTHLDKMLKWCEDTNVVLNWEKCHFMVKEGIVLGHKISKSGIEIDKAKVDVIEKLPHPTTVRDQDRATIAKSSTLPHDSAPRVTSPAAEEGSMQQTLNELTDFCTSLQRQHLELLAKFQAHEVEIIRLKERVKYLEDKEGVSGDKSGDDAPIKGRKLQGVLTSLDATNVLAGETNVPNGSGSIPTTGPPATIVPTGSEVGLTASPTVRRRKGKEILVESDTPKKKKLQEQIDAQIARELEEQQEREYLRMNEQIARDDEDPCRGRDSGYD